MFVNVINRRTHKKLKMIVPRCRHLTATDYSVKMLQKAEKNCAAFRNIRFAQADITALAFADGSFDKVVAGNVIHLLDDPLKALGELNRVCKDGGTLIIPTYMNKDAKGKTSGFASTVGKAGAAFRGRAPLRSEQSAGKPADQFCDAAADHHLDRPRFELS